MSKKGFRHGSGFTLIELIVTISISLILLWQGLVRYNDFNRKQQLRNSALSFVSTLRLAQNNVLTGDKKCTGDLLNGYRVETFTNTNRYRIRAECTGGNNSTWENNNLRSNFVLFLNNYVIFFRSPYGDVEASADPYDILLRHMVSADVMTVRVSRGGQVSCVDCD